MLRTGHVPARQSEGGAAHEQPRVAAAPAPAPRPRHTPTPHHRGLGTPRGPSGVSIKVEEEGEEEEGWQREGASPGPARVPASGPRAALAAAPATAPRHDVPAAGRARASGVTLVKEEEAEEEAPTICPNPPLRATATPRALNPVISTIP